MRAPRSTDSYALSALRRLSEPAAVLGMAPRGRVAIIARRYASGEVRETFRLPALTARIFAARGWIARRPGGKIAARYGITPAGRDELRRLVIEAGGAPPADDGLDLRARLESIRRVDGSRALRADEVDGALGWLSLAALLDDLGPIPAWLGDCHPAVVEVCALTLFGCLPFAVVARRLSMPSSAVRRLTATGVRAIARGHGLVG